MGSCSTQKLNSLSFTPWNSGSPTSQKWGPLGASLSPGRSVTKLRAPWLICFLTHSDQMLHLKADTLVTSESTQPWLSPSVAKSFITSNDWNLLSLLTILCFTHFKMSAYIHKKTCTWTPIAPLFKIAKNEKHPTIHQQEKGWTNCGTFGQWGPAHRWKRTSHWHVQQHGWMSPLNTVLRGRDQKKHVMPFLWCTWSGKTDIVNKSW